MLKDLALWRARMALSSARRHVARASQSVMHSLRPITSHADSPRPEWEGFRIGEPAPVTKTRFDGTMAGCGQVEQIESITTLASYNVRPWKALNDPVQGKHGVL